MQKIDLGKSIGILANLGVIGGIVFLGFELRQNQLIGRSQTQTAIADARRKMTQSWGLSGLANTIWYLLSTECGRLASLGENY